ncbi:MAG: hypothetical protein WCG92_03845 [Hyphomicrobiales bacterium]
MTSLAASLRAVAAALFAVAAAVGFAKQAQAAGAAYQVDTAEVSEAGSCKVESWISSASNHDVIASISPACVVSLFRPIEVSAQFSRSRSDGEWGTSVSPKAKTNIIPTAIGSWGVAISATASYDLITKENTALFVTVPATLRVSNVVRINLNAGWQLDRTTNRNYFTYGAGFDWRTPDNVWTVTGEMFGQAGVADETGIVEPRFQLGLRYRPVDQFNIDLIYGRNLAGERANWITLATVIRFKPQEK